MVQRLSRWLLYDVMGWTKDVTVAHPKKYIICYAPHTSNWDFIIARLYHQAEHFHSNFLMKREWFFWPLGILFRRMGGIPVHRDKNQHLTSQLAKIAKESERFALTITPEGTRSLNPRWKLGFYYIACQAEIPILLYGADYAERRIVCTSVFHPTGDVDADMKTIQQYYMNMKGRHPEKFAINPHE